jgi:putative heme-binding domain-containing protein
MIDALKVRTGISAGMSLFILSLLTCRMEAQETTDESLTATFVPVVAEHAKVPEGFQIEKIFEVPRSMGSWVSLAVDPKGGLVASDQGDAGLYSIQPGSAGQPTHVNRLPIEITSAQGLLFAFDALFAVVNDGAKSGLYRITDSDGDAVLDDVQLCMPLQGGGEHGPHAIILDPSGQSLYVAAGNHTKLPTALRDSRVPTNWQEDLLLPRRWDANGHAAGILAPGGWICEVDASGKEWTVHSIGFRNEYDIAFNADGELMTYDADMEWDFGSPWYRPTRVLHATSGSEFGWRSGTGKWPDYYEDSLPGAVDIGPGSPTGIIFGYGAKFPAKYQKALFVLDWTYSTIYAVHLSPSGSSYTATFEDFVTGSPLPVTDAVIGGDGALYFAVGGRGTQSSVYRVSYTGEQPVDPATLENAQGQEARSLRSRLESFHGSHAATTMQDQDLDWVLSHLGSQDRFVRYAARVALEFQPTDRWRDRVLRLDEPAGLISGLLALARMGSPSDLDLIAENLIRLDYRSLSQQEQLAAIRTLQVAIARRMEGGNTLSEELRPKVLALLESFYPSNIHAIDAELVQLLVFLKSPVVVEKTLELMSGLGPESIPDWGYLVTRNEGYGGTVGKMLENMPPVRAIHFAFVLRNFEGPWTLEQRRNYFSFFLQAAKHPGGASYTKFLEQFREDALNTCSESERIAVDDIIMQSLSAPEFQSTPPEGPGRKWTTAEAVTELGDKLSKRNYQRGRNLFHATSCAKCHRLAGEGGAIGPDLSTAGKKFSMTDLVDAIVDPSRVISDQYGSHQILTVDGEVLIGRAVQVGDQWYVYQADPNATAVILQPDDIESMQPSAVSQMPEGLVDSLNAEELRDLIAYIVSAGDPRAAVYRR